MTIAFAILDFPAPYLVISIYSGGRVFKHGKEIFSPCDFYTQRLQEQHTTNFTLLLPIGASFSEILVAADVQAPLRSNIFGLCRAEGLHLPNLTRSSCLDCCL